MKLAEPRTFRWTRGEYHKLASSGSFEGRRVQLIAGEIIEMPPMGHAHAAALSNAHIALTAVYGPDHWVRCQMPLALGAESEPEPDVAVAEHGIKAYRDHPTTALLVVEVSDTTLRHDRRLAGLYATAGVREYWIVNLREHVLEVHRNPVPDTEAEFGHRYAEHMVLDVRSTVSPVTLPGRTIRVEDLFG